MTNPEVAPPVEVLLEVPVPIVFYRLSSLAREETTLRHVLCGRSFFLFSLVNSGVDFLTSQCEATIS